MNLSTPIARTPLHQWHAAHGGRFADRDGWQTVGGYTTADKEIEAVRDSLGVVDISATSKLGLRGSGVAAAVEALIPGRGSLKPCALAPIPGTRTLACRLTVDHLLLLETPVSDAAQKRLQLDTLLRSVANL